VAIDIDTVVQLKVLKINGAKECFCAFHGFISSVMYISWVNPGLWSDRQTVHTVQTQCTHCTDR